MIFIKIMYLHSAEILSTFLELQIMIPEVETLIQINILLLTLLKHSLKYISCLFPDKIGTNKKRWQK